MPASEGEILVATGITKTYAGVRALKGAHFGLRAGEVHALVGENGAGKSTLVKIITGAVPADSGELRLNGNPIAANSPAIAKSLGISAIYQQPALFPELSVTENIALAQERVAPWRKVDWRARRRTAASLLARVGARFGPDTVAAELSMPEQQLVEIARAVGANARVLILDEPTAALSEDDTQNLFRVIRELRADGVGMIYISHRLGELPVIADRVTVLRDGETIDTRNMSEVDATQLVRLMVGRPVSAVYPSRTVECGDVVFGLRDVVNMSTGVRGVSFDVRAGEVVGLAGLVGAGRTELAHTVFGLTPATSGEIRLRGQSVAIRSPEDAVACGIAYLPEDRRRHGVIMDMPISENVTLASLDRLSRSGMLDLDEEARVSAGYVQRLGIKTASIRAPVSTLSGGNQQKVALSRWLMTKPAVLILDEPTQGVDVGAKSEIHALINELAAQGMAIVLISSELPELLGMSDRIVVMRGGAIAGTLDRADATPERLMSLAFGHSDE
jgi:rhamnose transport system ATP-binding protein